MRYILKRRFPARYRLPAGKGRKRLRRMIPVLAGIWVLWMCVSELGLSSLSEELTEEAARGYLLSSVNRAVDEALREGDTPFVSVCRSGSGQVADLSVDAARLNQVKAGVLNRLAKSISGKATAYVPIGSLTEIGVFNGRGPKVPVKLKLEGSADVSFETEFVSAGVNQSCHRIMMTVKVQAYSQSKRFAAQVEEETSTVLAETVVVGEVPGVALTAG